MKLDLDDTNVEVLEVSVATVRAYFDGLDIEESIPDFTASLDNAQGHVFGGDHKVSYLVIKVTA